MPQTREWSILVRSDSCFAFGSIPRCSEVERAFSPLMTAWVVPFLASMLAMGERQEDWLNRAHSSSFWPFFVLVSTKTILTNMRVRLTCLFNFWFENHASQAMSTENFPFWVQENGSVLENEIIFEKMVNLSKNSQKLFFFWQTAAAQRARNSFSRCTTSDRRQWKIAPCLKDAARQRKVAPGLNGDSWQRKVAPCLDDAAAYCKQSLPVMITTELSRIWRRRRWSKPIYGHSHFEGGEGWTSGWSCLRIRLSEPNYQIRGGLE